MPAESRPMRDIIAAEMDDTMLGGEHCPIAQRAQRALQGAGFGRTPPELLEAAIAVARATDPDDTYIAMQDLRMILDRLRPGWRTA